MQTYYKLKVLFDYVIPLGILAAVILFWVIYIAYIFIREKIRKRRREKKGEIQNKTGKYDNG